MPIPIQQTLRRSFERIEKKYNREPGKGYTGTGFESLDGVLRGVHTGDLIISDRKEEATSAEEFTNNIREIVLKEHLELVVIDSMPIYEKYEMSNAVHALKELALSHEIAIFLVVDIPVESGAGTKLSHSHLKSLGNIEDFADALCFMDKETVCDTGEHGEKENDSVIISNYSRSCRLFINEETGELMERMV